MFLEYCFFHAAGPDLPIEKCYSGSMITSPIGTGVILLCSYSYPEPTSGIYQMSENSNGQLQWTKMKQEIKYPKGDTLVDYTDFPCN